MDDKIVFLKKALCMLWFRAFLIIGQLLSPCFHSTYKSGHEVLYIFRWLNAFPSRNAATLQCYTSLMKWVRRGRWWIYILTLMFHERGLGKGQRYISISFPELSSQRVVPLRLFSLFLEVAITHLLRQTPLKFSLFHSCFIQFQLNTQA